MCDNGHRYEDSNIVLGDGVLGATFIGNRVGPCPVCGSMASIVDGTYDVVDGAAIRRTITSAVRGLTGQTVDVDALLAIRRVLEEARAAGYAGPPLQQKLEREVPSVRGRLDWLSSPEGMATAAWLTLIIPSLLALISILIALRSTSGSGPPARVSDQQIQQIVDQTLHTIQVTGTSAPPSPTSAEHPPPARHEPCWCGSGKRYRNCHGE